MINGEKTVVRFDQNGEPVQLVKRWGYQRVAVVENGTQNEWGFYMDLHTVEHDERPRFPSEAVAIAHAIQTGYEGEYEYVKSYARWVKVDE